MCVLTRTAKFVGSYMFEGVVFVEEFRRLINFQNLVDFIYSPPFQWLNDVKEKIILDNVSTLKDTVYLLGSIGINILLFKKVQR